MTDKNETFISKKLTEVLSTEITYQSALQEILDEEASIMQLYPEGSSQYTILQNAINTMRRIRNDGYEKDPSIPTDILKNLKDAFNEIEDRFKSQQAIFLSNEEKFLKENQNITPGIKKFLERNAKLDEYVNIITSFQIVDIPTLAKIILFQQETLNKFYTNYTEIFNQLTAALTDKSVKHKIKEIEKRLSSQISNLLITPIQRIPRHILFLTEILKEAREANNATEIAVYQPILESVTRLANDINHRKREVDQRQCMLNFNTLLMKGNNADRAIKSIITDFNTLFKKENEKITFDLAKPGAKNSMQLGIIFAIYDKLSNEAKKNVKLTGAVTEALLKYKVKKYNSNPLTGVTSANQARDAFFSKHAENLTELSTRHKSRPVILSTPPTTTTTQDLNPGNSTPDNTAPKP